MGIKQLLEKNTAVTVLIAIVILGISLSVIIASIISSNNVGLGNAWYYDLNTGELFTRPVSGTLPIESPTDTGEDLSGVRAIVFSCGSCEVEGDRYIAYLQTERVESVNGVEFSQAYYAAPNTMKWYAASSPKAIGLMNASTDRCGQGSGMPKECLPSP